MGPQAADKSREDGEREQGLRQPQAREEPGDKSVALSLETV